MSQTAGICHFYGAQRISDFSIRERLSVTLACLWVTIILPLNDETSRFIYLHNTNLPVYLLFP